LVSQIQIASAFWLIIVPAKDFEAFEDALCKDRPMSCFLLYADHWLPFAFIVIDFIISHAMMLKRQWFSYLIFATVYWIINLIWSKIAGANVYPAFDWNSFLGIA
jgi:hypothetical protein